MKRLIPIIILFVAAWARFGALAEDVRFHGDEALFATYARNAAVSGDWLLTGPLDKPPVSLYAMALSMQFTGVTTLPDGVLTLAAARGEWSARLAGALAGIVMVALLMSAAQRLGGRRAGWFAGALAACSPQLVGFSATAFTDPLLLTFLVASLTSALYNRPGWSGVWLAVAFATKQQAVFYVPLVAAVIVCAGIDGGTPARATILRPLRRFFVPFMLGVGVLLLWDALRPGLSIFEIAADNNNPYRTIVPPAEWPARVRLIAVFMATLFGAWPATAAVVACAIAGGIGIKKLKHSGDVAIFTRTSATKHIFLNSIALRISVCSVSLWFQLFFLFALLYLLAHIVLPFNVYDRYFLFVVPPLIVLAARTLARHSPRRLTLPALAVILMLALTAPARFPTDVRDRSRELIVLADFINTQGIGTIVYNRWLGWEMGYYLGAWSDKRVVFYPTPQQFSADAPRNPDPAPRLLIAPGWAPVRAWLAAAETAGFRVRSAYRSANYAAWWLEYAENTP